MNENDYNEIKYKKDQYLKILQNEMEDLDGLDFCAWTETSGIDITNCTLEKYGGFLGIPTNDMVTIMT